MPLCFFVLHSVDAGSSNQRLILIFSRTLSWENCFYPHSSPATCNFQRPSLSQPSLQAPKIQHPSQLTLLPQEEGSRLSPRCNQGRVCRHDLINSFSINFSFWDTFSCFILVWPKIRGFCVCLVRVLFLRHGFTTYSCLACN